MIAVLRTVPGIDADEIVAAIDFAGRAVGL